MASRVFLLATCYTLVVLVWLANLWPTQLPTEPYARAKLLADRGFPELIPFGPQIATSGPITPDQLFTWIDREADRRVLSTPLRRRLNTLAANPDETVLAKVARSYALVQVEGDPQKALRELKTLNDQQPMVLATRALALAAVGRDEAALAVWRQALQGRLSWRERNHFADFCASRRFLGELARLPRPEPSVGIERYQIWQETYAGSVWKAIQLESRDLLTIGPWAWLASLLSAAVWVGILTGRSLLVRILGYLAGVLSFLLVYPLLDSLMWKLHLVEIRTSLSLGFFRYFVEAGILEGLTRLAPLLIWWWAGQLKRPQDWVLFACLSALGFSTFESLGYNDWHWGASLGRFVMGPPGHLALTAATAYTLARSRRMRPWLAIGVFLLTALVHASYDYSDGLKPLIVLLEGLFLSWILWGQLRAHSLGWLAGTAVLLLALSFWHIHTGSATDVANYRLLSDARFLVALPAFWGFLLAPKDWGLVHWMVFLSVAGWSGSLLWWDPAFCLMVMLSFYFLFPLASSACSFGLWPDRPSPTRAPTGLQELGFRSVPVTAQGSKQEHRSARRKGWIRWSLAMTLAQSIWLPQVVSMLLGSLSAAEFTGAWCQGFVMLFGFNFCWFWPATLLSPVLLGAWSHPDGISMLAIQGLRGRPAILVFSASTQGYLMTVNGSLRWTIVGFPLPRKAILCRRAQSYQYSDLVGAHRDFLATLEPAEVKPEGNDPDTFLSAARQHAREPWLVSLLEFLRRVFIKPGDSRQP